MIPMRAFDVLCNLKNWGSWDYKAYKLQENEAYSCIKALENYIWHNVDQEGMPKEDGWYLFKTSTGYKSLYFDLKIANLAKYNDIVKWRKIVDDEEDK